VVYKGFPETLRIVSFYVTTSFLFIALKTRVVIKL